MADEANIPTHRWYQDRNHIKLPMQDVSESVIKAAGIAKIDQFMITAASDALFVAGEVGVWYDPSDLTTLFQDSAGTTPVTAAGQPVGLMLDKSKASAFGADIVTNGDFSDGSTGWTLGTGVTISGGIASFTAGSGYLSQLITTEAGRAYKVTATAGINNSFSMANNNANQNGVLPLLSGGASAAGRSGTFSFIFVALDTTSYIDFTPAGNLAGTIDNVSVIPLPLGNHATQATSAQRPTYGIHPYSGVRNLLSYSEDFANATWGKTGTTCTTGSFSDPVGGLNATKYTITTAGTFREVGDEIAAVSGNVFTFSIYLKAGDHQYASVKAQSKLGASLVNTFGLVKVNLADGTQIGSPTGTVSVTSVFDGWYRVSVSGTVAALSDTAYFAVNFVDETGSPNPVTNIPANSFMYIFGAQAESGASVTSYQKVVTRYNITETGVPSVHYIGFDGVDDGMVTSTITPATNKAQIFSGFRKSALNNGATLAELSASSDTNNGSVAFFADAIGGSGIYQARTRGTVLVPTNYNTAPVGTAVIAFLADLAAPSQIIRVNGSQVISNTANTGTGDFLAYPLYIGRRAGTSVPLNGNIYSLIVRFGSTLTAAQITNTETLVNGKTGAF